MLTQIAKGLRFTGCEDYEKAALTRINDNKALRSALKAKLGKLASELEEPISPAVIAKADIAGAPAPRGA